MQFEDSALKSNARAFASRSRAKAKPRRSTSACSSTRTVPICESFLTDIEPGTCSNFAFPVSKRMTTLLRHGPLPREEDGAIEFWRLKDYLRNEFENSQQRSDEMWKSKMAGGGGIKKRFQYCTDSPGQEILYLRALQGNSGRNPIDPSLTRQCVNRVNFFEYIYIGCAINLHSITNSGLILGGQNLSKRQTVFFTSVVPMNKEHEDPNNIYLEAPRLASYKQKTWKRHQDTVYWVNIQLAQRKGLKFYQTRSNAIILCDTLPAYCLPKVVVMESVEIIYEKVYMSPRPLPKFSFQRQLDERIGFRSCWKQQRLPTNPTKTKNPIIKNGETRGRATVHPGDRKRCLVWSRRHHKPKNFETYECIVIQPELCASVCWTCR